MMMVDGITLYVDRLPAVVVPPAVAAEMRNIASVETDAEPVRAYSGTSWQQHQNPFDRTLQEFYDIHGKMIHKLDLSGSQLNKLI